jgi:uncharacterized protein
MIPVRPSRIHGQGAFAAKYFDEGDQVGVYEGKRDSARQVSRRTWATGLTYVFGLSDGSVIDAAIDGYSPKHQPFVCAEPRGIRGDRPGRRHPYRLLCAAPDSRRRRTPS